MRTIFLLVAALLLIAATSFAQQANPKDSTEDDSNEYQTFFSNKDYFTSVEVGWVSSKDRYFFDNIHLTWWHSDGSEVTASLPGWGMAFSGTWFFQDKIMPFLRGGYAKDGGTLLQKSVTAGIGYYHAKGGNVLGAAIGWGEVNESTWASGLEDQVTATARRNGIRPQAGDARLSLHYGPEGGRLRRRRCKISCPMRRVVTAWG